MSHVKKLIDEHCPEGVKSNELGAISTLVRGQHMTKELASAGRFPVVSASREKLATHNTSNHPGNAVTVSSHGAYAGFVEFWPDEIWLGNNVFLFECSPEVSSRFLYHVLKSMEPEVSALAKSGGVPYINASQLEKLLIPVPPLQVQEAIVEILDDFKALINDLETEHALRKKQFDHALKVRFAKYLENNSLLSTIGEISLRVSSGSTPLAGKAEFYDEGTIPWLRTQEVKFVDIKDTAIRITENALAKTSVKWIPANCVIVAISGATAGRSAVNAIPLTTNQHCCNLEIDPEKASFRFVFYWLLRQFEHLKTLGQGVRSDITSSMVKGYKLPLPPIEEQELLVSDMDAFYKLINDDDGLLTLEIAARRQQFEHYRDQLLTFKEA